MLLWVCASVSPCAVQGTGQPNLSLGPLGTTISLAKGRMYQGNFDRVLLS